MRVGLGPPPRSRSRLGVPAARAIQNAALDTSPRTTSSRPERLAAGDANRLASLLDPHAKFMKRPLRMIARWRVRGGRFAFGLETSEKNRALDLSARHFRPMGDAAQPRASIVSGGRPSCDPIAAPISVSGRMTRAIRRRLSEASPLIVCETRVRPRTDRAASWSRSCLRRVAWARPRGLSPRLLSERPRGCRPNDPAHGAPSHRAPAGSRGREAVGAGQVAADGRATVGERREHGVSVGD